MSKHEKIFQAMKKGPIVLRNEIEGALIKIEGGKYFAKFPGEQPYEVAGESEIVTNAILEGIFASENEFSEK